MEERKQGYHFVLVHGACHGAWCWYKLKPLLEGCGHRVTALDLAASGRDPNSIKEIKSFSDYSEPLIKVMSSLPPQEKVILVGHSYGGMNIALAMEMFPEKVLVGVFLTAFMPDTENKPSYVLEKWMERIQPETWSDMSVETYDTPEGPLKPVLFNLDFVKHNLYQLCSIQDLTLATMLLRPTSLFDIANLTSFSSEGYGSVKRVYIVCDQDQSIPVEFQRWMIENGKLEEVKEIKGSDHMAMLCKPQELCDCLLEIANEQLAISC